MPDARTSNIQTRPSSIGHRASRPGRLTVIAFLASLAAGAILAPAASAAPAISITDYKIISTLPPSLTVPANGPSTLQAGANPDAGSYTTFGYTSATEDLETALTNFAPGLLGNAEAVPKCPEANLQAGTCPANTLIGTSRLDTVAAGTVVPTGSFPGTVYNAEPLGNEPGRLGVRTPTPLGALVSSIPFTLTPRGSKDYGLTGTLTDVNRLPSPPFGANLQVSGLSFLLNGSVNSYVRNPTSCANQTSTGQAVGYDDPTAAGGPPYAFTTTGCDQLAFGPGLALEIGDRGTTEQYGFPTVIIKITQPGGQADQRNNRITLPVELNTNNPAYELCTQEQADADSCPAASQFGGVVAHSPFLSEALSGPVYLIQQTASSLPGLLLDLQGRAHVKIQTSTVLVGGKQIQSVTADAPQLPISDLTVALNGGRQTGVFQNRSDLCFKSGSTSEFKTVTGKDVFEGWNAKSTGTRTTTVTVNGCPPSVAPHLGDATGSQPRLRVRVRRHPGSPNMKELRVTVGDNLSLVRGRLGKGASASALEGVAFSYVNRHTLDVRGLPSAGASRVTLVLEDGAVRVSRFSRRLLGRGKSRRFAVKVKQTPVSGLATSTRATFRVKGR